MTRTSTYQLCTKHTDTAFPYSIHWMCAVLQHCIESCLWSLNTNKPKTLSCWLLLLCKPSCRPIDHFKMEVVHSSRRFPIPNCHQHIAGTHSLQFPMLVSRKPILSLKSLQIRSCDPVCQIRKIFSLFGTLGDKQSMITCLLVSVSWYLAILVISNQNSTFVLHKSCLEVVRLAMYMGIFQFHCTWKFENCRIFLSNEQ